MLLLDTDPTSGRHTIYVNASAYKVTACPRRAFYTILAGLRDTGNQFKMEFGTAFHKFAAMYHNGGNKAEGISLAVDHYVPFQESADWRDLQYLIKTCKAYSDWHDSSRIYHPWKLPDGKFALEQKFAVPFYSTATADYILCGTVDMLAEHPCFGLVLVDHKTTSVRTKDSYLAEYRFSPQLLMYNMIMQKLGLKIKGSLINGIFLGKSMPPVVQVSDLIEFSPQQIAEFEAGLKSFVTKLDNAIVAYKANPGAIEIFRRDFTQCSAGKFGLCPFSALCTQDTQTDVDNLATGMFKRQIYNPLTNYEATEV